MHAVELMQREIVIVCNKNSIIYVYMYLSLYRYEKDNVDMVDDVHDTHSNYLSDDHSNWKNQ